MTQPATLCPNCGGPVVFRWSSSVQTTCEHCHSILVRTDLNLELVGVVADLPPENSAIQIGTEGSYRNRNFTVAGRIIYSYAQGSWNEWHLVLSDGHSAWLSDAQSQYAITVQVTSEQLPPETAALVGKGFRFQNTDFSVTTITLARYRGVQGELPFQYWDKKDATFVDLLSETGKFATIDYSDGEAALYVGEMVDFDSLKLRNLRDERQGDVSSGPKTKGLNCSNCGAAIELLAPGQTVSVVCGSCHSVMDASDEKMTILQRFQGKMKPQNILLPLGSKGKWRGAEYGVIGYQMRVGQSDGITFDWREYVLFNPSRGFRYLTEYNGHWNDATPITALPQQRSSSLRYLGTSYAHFQTVNVRTAFVLGEFPWQVRVGETVEVTDYVAPPRILSAEKTDKEVTWSLSEYVYGKDLWKAFDIAGQPPAPIGVFENQPGPAQVSLLQIWGAFGVLVGLMVLILSIHEAFAGKGPAFSGRYDYVQKTGAEASFVTPYFNLSGRTSSVELRTDAAVANQWIYLNYALINADTGQAFDVGREVSFYSGSDSDGPWTEGSRHDEVLIPSVPSGRYYLRVEPETDATVGDVDYTVTVTRDVPAYDLYWIALVALLVPAILLSWRRFNFEQMRWAESDHPRVKVFHG